VSFGPHAETFLRELFRPIHPPGTLENNLAPEHFKGVIDPAEAEQVRLRPPLLCGGGLTPTDEASIPG
jgi:hypothetical protein